jgi:hypothetical protein
LPWPPPRWLPEVESWARAELEHQEIAQLARLGGRQLRPWSAVLSAPMSAREGYFKAAAPFPTRGPALAELLASGQGRGWLLLADAVPGWRQEFPAAGVVN